MHTSMEKIGSFAVLALTLMWALMAAPVAIAQTGRSGGGVGAPANPTVPPSLGASPSMQAPVGHLQPRRDMSGGDQPYQSTAEDKALDRKIKSICRGC